MNKFLGVCQAAGEPAETLWVQGNSTALWVRTYVGIGGYRDFIVYFEADLGQGKVRSDEVPCWMRRRLVREGNKLGAASGRGGHRARQDMNNNNNYRGD